MNKDIDAQFLCKNCARYNLCQYYHGRKEDSYICKYFHLTETNRQEPRWIPASERLPGEEGYYLVTTDGTYNDTIDIAHYTKGSWHKASRIKAWMPLPEPYKAESEG